MVPIFSTKFTVKFQHIPAGIMAKFGFQVPILPEPELIFEIQVPFEPERLENIPVPVEITGIVFWKIRFPFRITPFWSYPTQPNFNQKRSWCDKVIGV
jgi:hypothetical protein